MGISHVRIIFLFRNSTKNMGITQEINITMLYRNNGNKFDYHTSYNQIVTSYHIIYYTKYLLNIHRYF